MPKRKDKLTTTRLTVEFNYPDNYTEEQIAQLHAVFIKAGTSALEYFMEPYCVVVTKVENKENV